ncbi:SRPBCC family protein [Phenylobacterium sp.]|uniref:SRPBCC family protein n=1 Tax=Phenylobacterium sp. TaxID=1871053 RepID=UPI0030F3878B
MTSEPWGQFPAPGTVRFERRLPGPIERVWSYFADSDLRGQWLAPGPLEGRVGGTLELGFKHSELSPEPYDPPGGRGSGEARHILRCEVLEIDPPRRLSFRWGEDTSVVVVELTPVGDEVALVITQSGLSAGHMTEVAGGWHTHLAILEDRANGRVPQPFWKIWASLDGAYEGRVVAG